MKFKLLYLSVFCCHIAACGTLTPPPDSIPTVAAAPGVPGRSEALLQVLLALGLDYRNGGSSHATGFDCSGLVAHVYLEAYGIRLPRSARAQSALGTPVEMSELQPGDLVFYDTLGSPYSHVGIYLGEGRFVHAPKQGARIRFERLHAAYWTQRFNGARRLGI
jgi:cell wall-associated NlpC family hydrolase